jgi:hypothetical protein
MTETISTGLLPSTFDPTPQSALATAESGSLSMAAVHLADTLSKKGDPGYACCLGI